MSDVPDNDPPCTKIKSSILTSTPPKPGVVILEDTPKAANESNTSLIQNGFCYSIINFDFGVLLNITISVNELKPKLDSYTYKWEGDTTPTYAHGEVDDKFGMCPQCGKYCWDYYSKQGTCNFLE